MANNTESSATRASDEATDWLIRLQDAPGDRVLRDEFTTWHDASTLNAAAWAATEHTAGVLAAMPASRAADWRAYVEDIRRPEVQIPGPRPTDHRRSQRPRLMQACALAVAACLAFIFVPGLIIEMRVDYETAAGEVRTVVLADGSRVTLAPESAVALAYGAKDRGIEVLRGEAFFEVAPDPTRPFRVAARDVDVTVLGSAFDVRLAENDVAVAVAHGRVRVDFGTADVRNETLTTGEVIRVAGNGDVVQSIVLPTQVAAWRTQQLIAEDRSIADVLDQLRRYVPGAILVTDADLARRTVTGVYNLDNPVDAVRGIAQAHGAVVRQITPWLLVISAH